MVIWLHYGNYVQALVIISLKGQLSGDDFTLCSTSWLRFGEQINIAWACKMPGSEHNATKHFSVAGIGAEVYQVEIDGIATDPSFVYEVSGFEALHNVTQTIINMTCKVCKSIIHTPSSRCIAKSIYQCQDYRWSALLTYLPCWITSYLRNKTDFHTCWLLLQRLSHIFSHRDAVRRNVFEVFREQLWRNWKQDVQSTLQRVQ